MMRALLGTLLVLTACREREVPLDAPAARATATTQAPQVLEPAVPASFVHLVSGARRGVVGIRSAKPVKSGPAAMFPGVPDSIADVALGTGFLVELKGTYVVTNDHIAAAATELQVVLYGQTTVPARIVGRDPRLDIALLAIDAGQRLTALPLGESDDLQVGQWVVALGNAIGEEVTASAGIISATGRESAGSLAEGRLVGYRTYLQTDARIHRGNSGGPVLDTAGRVVGVAVTTEDRLRELSFIIPISRVKSVLEALRDHGQVARGWLGVKVLPVTKELAQELALPSEGGALVSEIVAGSPAARTSLRKGDVILKVDRRSVDHRDLPWLVAQAPVGKPMTFEVWRNKASITVPVLTENMPE